jgi:hypothetical protein
LNPFLKATYEKFPNRGCRFSGAGCLAAGGDKKGLLFMSVVLLFPA